MSDVTMQGKFCQGDVNVIWIFAGILKDIISMSHKKEYEQELIVSSNLSLKMSSDLSVFKGTVETVKAKLMRSVYGIKIQMV